MNFRELNKQSDYLHYFDFVQTKNQVDSKAFKAWTNLF